MHEKEGSKLLVVVELDGRDQVTMLWSVTVGKKVVIIRQRLLIYPGPWSRVGIRNGFGQLKLGRSRMTGFDVQHQLN